jgi:hypothetical protein
MMLGRVLVDIIADIIATDASVRAFMRTTYYKKGSLKVN